MDTPSHSFVVKIWEEPRGFTGTPRLWRGSVEDVEAGTRVYFSTLLELCAQLEQRTGMSWSGQRKRPARRVHPGFGRRPGRKGDPSGSE